MEWADLTEEYTSALTSSDSLLTLGTTERSAETESSSPDATTTPDSDGDRSHR